MKKQTTASVPRRNRRGYSLIDPEVITGHGVISKGRQMVIVEVLVKELVEIRHYRQLPQDRRETLKNYLNIEKNMFYVFRYKL